MMISVEKRVLVKGLETAIIHTHMCMISIYSLSLSFSLCMYGKKLFCFE